MADGDKPEDTQDPSKPDKDETDWKARYDAEKEAAKKWEKRAKENHEKAKRFDELEESQKTELQRAEERILAAEQRAEKAETENVRLRVALRKKLSDSQAKRLVGQTEEELEADADELLASFRGSAEENGSDKEQSDKDRSLRGPREALRSGARANEEPEPDIAEEINKIPRGI